MTGPIDSYRALVASGALRQDPMQALAAEKLQLLHNRLERHLAGNGKSGLLGLLKIGRPEAPPQGIYIYGDVGRGKSMLMDVFFDTAPVAAKRRVHFHEFMQDVHGAIHGWRQRHKRGEIRGDDPIPPVADMVAESARLLCFDEFQVTDIADAMILGRLFSGLFDRGVVVVATSNRAPDELYQDGLNRALFLPFIATLKEHVDVLELDGPVDYRLARMTGAPVYYTPLGPSTDARVQAAWERLTDVETGEEVVLDVKGRKLVVPEAARGVARFSFDDLCGRPLGAADYLKLAAVFHTLVLENIPALSPTERNEARRLVTLIDTLYDKRVKLVASAAADPAGLYPDGDGKFDFARTASRLMEMQSRDYLALGHGA
jgi:cell division protein ZapE